MSFWTLLVNAGLGLLLMQFWAHAGLAVALTLASLFNAIVLLWLLRGRIGELRLRALLQSTAKILPAVAFMGVAVWSVLQAGNWTDSGERFHNAVILFAAVLSGSLVYLAVSRMFGVQALAEIGRMLRKERSE